MSKCAVGSVRTALVHLEELALYGFEIVSKTTLALLRLATIVIPRFIVTTSSFSILLSVAIPVIAIHFAIVLVKVLANLCLHIVLLLGLLRLGTTSMVHFPLTAV